MKAGSLTYANTSLRAYGHSARRVPVHVGRAALPVLSFSLFCVRHPVIWGKNNMFSVSECIYPCKNFPTNVFIKLSKIAFVRRYVTFVTAALVCMMGKDPTLIEIPQASSHSMSFYKKTLGVGVAIVSPINK